MKTGVTFRFPDDFVLPASSYVRLWSGKKASPKDNTPHDLFWTNRHVWGGEGASAELRYLDNPIEVHTPKSAEEETDDEFLTKRTARVRLSRRCYVLFCCVYVVR